jgi:ribA/ribD-fused uncharacterized protein
MSDVLTSNEQIYRRLLERWLETEQRFTILGNDTRAVLSRSPDETRAEPINGPERSLTVTELQALSDEWLDTLDDEDSDEWYTTERNLSRGRLRHFFEWVRACRIPTPAPETSGEHHGLDNARQVFFYEQDFYVLSNFSAFRLNFAGQWHDTSEHAYHWMKFTNDIQVQNAILQTTSAHVAFKLAELYRDRRRPDWDAVKVDTMRKILRAKADQHEYVAKKLEATGDRELIENSWRDDFWGWGPNRDGRNMLGKLWMEIRAERRSRVKSAEGPSHE